MSGDLFLQRFTPVLRIVRSRHSMRQGNASPCVFPGGKIYWKRSSILVLEIQRVSAFSMRGCKNFKGIDLGAGYSKERLIR